MFLLPFTLEIPNAQAPFELISPNQLHFCTLSAHMAFSHMQKPYPEHMGGRAVVLKRSSPWVGEAQPAVSTLERSPGCCTSVTELKPEQIRGSCRMGTKYREATVFEIIPLKCMLTWTTPNNSEQ